MTAVEITKIPNFISDEDCSLLVDAFERNALTNSANDFWDDMIVYPGKITDRNVLGLMANTGRRTREVILKNYQPEEIFSDSIMLCRWGVGKKLTAHWMCSVGECRRTKKDCYSKLLCDLHL